MHTKLLVFALLYATAFAEDDYDEAFKDFKSYPSNVNEEVGKWVEPSDPTFSPYEMLELCRKLWRVLQM